MKFVKVKEGVQKAWTSSIKIDTINRLEKFKMMYNKYPQRVIADSGYGSEDNYEYLKERDIE